MAEHSFFNFGTIITQKHYAHTSHIGVTPVDVEVVLNKPAMSTYGLMSILGISADRLVNVAFIHPAIFDHVDRLEFREWFNGSCSGNTWCVKYLCTRSHYFDLPYSLNNMMLKSNYGAMKSYHNDSIPAIYFEHASDLMIFKLAWSDTMIASYQKKEPDSTELNKIDYKALRERLANKPVSGW